MNLKEIGWEKMAGFTWFKIVTSDGLLWAR